MNIHVLKVNSLNVPRGLYADWMGNSLSDSNANTLISEGAAILTNIGSPYPGSVSAVAASRTLTQDDNGKTLDCAEDVILTIPPGLSNFGCAIRPDGVQVACGAGVTINGDDETLTTTARVGAINPTATANAYDVVGV
jgi:hypothetical protein